MEERLITQQINAAVVAMTSHDDKAANLATAHSLVAKAAEQGAQWVILPELFTFNGPYESLYENAEYNESPTLKAMARWSADYKIVLFAGSVPERSDSEPTTTNSKKVFNTAFVFDRTGQTIARYRKCHLFNLRASDGTSLYDEGSGFSAGSDFCTLTIDGWRVGIATCYDIRFPEFLAKLSRSSLIDALILPSAFTETTGQDHWHLLTRTRALDLQCYVLSSNQVGEHRVGKRSYGHSLIVDPWGVVLADTQKGVGTIALATLHHNRVNDVRNRLPVLANRRSDLY